MENNIRVLYYIILLHMGNTVSDAAISVYQTIRSRPFRNNDSTIAKYDIYHLCATRLDGLDAGTSVMMDILLVEHHLNHPKYAAKDYCEIIARDDTGKIYLTDRCKVYGGRRWLTESFSFFLSMFKGVAEKELFLTDNDTTLRLKMHYHPVTKCEQVYDLHWANNPAVCANPVNVTAYVKNVQEFSDKLQADLKELQTTVLKKMDEEQVHLNEVMKFLAKVKEGEVHRTGLDATEL